MRIQHSITTRLSSVQSLKLRQAGIEALPGLQTLRVYEDAPSWAIVRDIALANDALDVVRTRFTAAEISRAACLRLRPAWHLGYPQPTEGWRALVYDLKDYCAACGVGARQVSPFRMTGEPRFGSRQVFQLNWVFDEFFVSRELWESVLAPLGMDGRMVLNRTGTAELTTVQQLSVPSVAVANVPLDDHPWSQCPVCNRRKYAPFVRGSLPSAAPPVGAMLFKSREWFGDGASAYHEVFAAGALARSLGQACPRGLTLEPARMPA